MQSSPFNKATLFLTLFLAVVAVGVGVSAYSEPRDLYTRYNTFEPIDISAIDQVKLGGLSVDAFSARGNANFKKDLSIKRVAMGCVGGCDATKKATTVTIANDLLAAGDLTAQKSFRVESLKHKPEDGLLPVCADENGIIIFCPGPSVPPPPPDLCDNIAGTQAVVGGNTGLSIDDPSKPKFCTQIIRGTITVDQWGPIKINEANNAMIGSMAVTNIKIISVGGVATNAWPSPIPLRFRWAYCASWQTNGKYSGPGPGNGAVFYNIQNGTQGNKIDNGYCQDFYAGYPYPTTPLYGYSGRTKADYLQFSPYVAFDGLTTLVSTPKGFFDARQYDATGVRGESGLMWYTLNLWYKKGYNNPEYSNVVRPPAKIILDDVKVPAGYKLDLVPTMSGTLIDIHYAP